MHESVWTTIFLRNIFLQREIIFLFSCYLVRKTYEVEHPWCLSFHFDFLGVLSSNVLIFRSTMRSLTREEHGTINTLNFVTLGMEILWLCI